jgi:TRAP-type transport system periplasmic protein
MKLVVLVAVLCLALEMAGCSQLSQSPPASPDYPAAPSASASSTGKSPASSTPAPMGTIKLVYVTESPEASATYIMTEKPVLDEIEKNSNGRIVFTRVLGSIMGNSAENYDFVKTGKADLTLFPTTYAPGRFPLSDVLSLPFAFETTLPDEDAALTIYDRILYKEFPDTHSLNIQQPLISYVYTTRKPVKTIEDLQELKIRTGGGFITSTLKALGAVPVPIDDSETNTSLQINIIEGAILDPTDVESLQLQNVLRHVTKNGFGTSPQTWTLNLATWDRMPYDLQQVVVSACRKGGSYMIGLSQRTDPLVTKALIDQGGSTYTLSPEEAKKATDLLKPAVDAWIEGIRSKGQPVDELLKIVREETGKRNVPFPY